MPDRRIVAIDFIRGLCLINIFVNHLANGQMNRISPSRIGFSDSADIFVLLSGVSTFLAFGRLAERPLSSLTETLWRRAGVIYLYNTGIIAGTFLVLFVTDSLLTHDGPHHPAIRLIVDHGTATVFWHALTLRQGIGFSCVLRLYVAMMLLAPVLVRLASWRWWAPLPPAVLVWAVAGHGRLVVDNSLSGDVFMLTILPWTLVFSLGIALGAAIRAGVVLPQGRLLCAVALTYLVGNVVVYTGATRIWPEVLDWANARNDVFWTGASKTYQSPLRLLHLMSLATIVTVLPNAPVIRLIHSASPRHVLCRLGRRSLEVFSFGAVACVAADEILGAVRGITGDALLPLMVLELVLIVLYVRLALVLADWLSSRKPRLSSAMPPAASFSRPVPIAE